MTDGGAAIKLLLIGSSALRREAVLEWVSASGLSTELSFHSVYDAGLQALMDEGFDVCLIEAHLAERNGIELLREAVRRGCLTPVIVLAPDSGAEVDRQAMEAGAADCLVKDQLDAAGFQRALCHVLERARRGEARRNWEERYALALDGSNDGIWDWRVETQALYLSPRWKHILGFGPDELPDALGTWWDRVHQEDRPQLMAALDAYLVGGPSPHFEHEHRLRHKDGTWRHVVVRGKAVRDAQGCATRIAGSLTDVTMARGRDLLTGLPNRVLYLDRLEHAFNRAAREASYVFAVLFIDIDRFKNVNDGLGHEVGDELLVAIARRLEGCLRQVDSVARAGGDEFVILLDDARQPDGATRVAGRIIEELGRPFSIASRELFTGASIGIVVSSPQYQTPGELLRDADTAMYRAKEQGRGRFVIFDPAMHARALQVMSAESGLRRAVDERQLEVFYQPVVSLGTQNPLGFEALVRWHHPERGLLSPAEFIPVAEDSNLIVLLDLHVLRTATAQVQAWREQFKVDLSIAVNASRRDFMREEFSLDVQQALEGARLQPSSLRLEVTETLTMDLPDASRTQLQRLHELGVQIYIDDFGMGYSSLSMLQTYPFNGIKLDRSFVWALAPSGRSTEVVRAVLAISQALRLDVVAEGVETQEQRDALMALGCVKAQGYYYAKPMPAAAAEAWLASKL